MVLVVIPTHNRKEFLEEAIQSILDQTQKPHDIVVTGNVAPPSGIRYIASDEPLHVRLNNAIEASDCDAFILLSDDDTILPEYIKQTVAKMEETGADVVYTEYNNEPVTSLIRKSIWKKVGGYCEGGFFDWDFYWSCREAGGLSVHLKEHLFEYRRHPEQEANHGRWKASGQWAEWEAQVLAKHPLRGKPCGD